MKGRIPGRRMFPMEEVNTVSHKTLCAKSAAALRLSAILTGGCNREETRSFLSVEDHIARVLARFCHREKTASFGLSFLRARATAGAP